MSDASVWRMKGWENLGSSKQGLNITYPSVSARLADTAQSRLLYLGHSS